MNMARYGLAALLLTGLATAWCKGGPVPTTQPQAPYAAKGALDANQAAQAQLQPIWRAMDGHSMRYLLSLPNGWSPQKKWPLLVVVTGSNSNFPVISKGYHQARGDLPFIIATPATVSSGSQISAERYPHLSADELASLASASVAGKLTYDMAGLELLLKDLRAHFGAEDKAYLSGFSMGGSLAWHAAFTVSDRLHAVFPVCAVYDPNAQKLLKDDLKPADTQLPILAFQGDKDGGLAMFNEAWQRASKVAGGLGFTNVVRKTTWRKHDWHYEEILYVCQGHHLGRQAAARER